MRRLQRCLQGLVQRQFVGFQGQPGKQRVLFKQEVADHIATVAFFGHQLAQGVRALQQAVQLGRQRVVAHALVKARQKRVIANRVGVQAQATVLGQFFGQCGLANADRAFNGNITVWNHG